MKKLKPQLDIKMDQCIKDILKIESLKEKVFQLIRMAHFSQEYFIQEIFYKKWINQDKLKTNKKYKKITHKLLKFKINNKKRILIKKNHRIKNNDFYIILFKIFIKVLDLLNN